jgi:hypothetical protein
MLASWSERAILNGLKYYRRGIKRIPFVSDAVRGQYTDMMLHTFAGLVFATVLPVAAQERIVVTSA